MTKIERFLYLFLSVVGYFILSFLFLGVAGSYLQKLQLPYISNIGKLAFLIISWYYIKILHIKINQVEWREYFSLKLNDILKFTVGLFLPLILTIISIIALEVVYSNFEYPALTHQFSLRLFLNSFITGYYEELFFRCFVFFSILKINQNLFFAAVISSVFFTLLHMGSIVEGLELVSVANLVIGGVLLSYLYYLTNSIWISIGFHTVNNIIAFEIDSIQQSFAYAYSQLFTYTLLISILLVFCILLANRKSKHHIRLKQ